MKLPILSININWDFIILNYSRNKRRLLSSLATVLYSHLNSDFTNLPYLWFSWLQEWPPLPSQVFLILRALVVLHNFTLGTWIFKCYLVSATFKKLFQMKNMFMNDKISFAWCDFFLKIKIFGKSSFLEPTKPTLEHCLARRKFWSTGSATTVNNSTGTNRWQSEWFKKELYPIIMNRSSIYSTTFSY